MKKIRQNIILFQFIFVPLHPKSRPLRKRCRFFSVLKGQDNHVNESQMSLKISTNEDKSHRAEQPIATAIPKWQ